MRILIVGAGPTGASLAYLLARRGIDVSLIEREPAFDRLFRGEALMPSGVDALYQMGFRDAFADLPHRTVECMELYVDGSRAVRADWPEIQGDNAARVVSQPRLLDLLTESASEHPSFDLRMGTTVRDIRVTNDGVELDLEKDSARETLRGDFLIGADGRASIVRARAGMKLDRLPFPYDVNWFSLPAPPSQLEDPRFQAFSRGDSLVILYPSWDGRLRLGVNQPVETARRQAPSKQELLEEVARITGEPFGSFVLDHIGEASDPITLKVLFGRCATWAAPRTLLLGDAVHPMSPVRAQGINLALRDAIVAANHLVPALERGASEASDTAAWDAAASKIQQEREPEIIASQQLQLQAAETPPPARSPILRKTVLPILRHLGIMKKMFLKAETPLRRGVVPVKLAV